MSQDSDTVPDQLPQPSPQVTALSLSMERIAHWSIPFFALVAVASISMQNIIYLGLAAWVVWLVLSKRAFFIKTPINWPLILLGLVLIASSLWEGRLNSSLFGIRKVGLMLIFFMTANVIRHPLKAERALNLFLAGAGICAAWSIVSHLLGWDGGRAHSFSGDYMAAGGMYMLSLVISASLFLYSKEARQWRYLGLSLLLTLALVFTYTRSSWIGAAMALLVIGALKDWRLPAIFMAVALLLLVLFPHTPVAQRVFSIDSKYQSSNVERRYMWVSAFKLIKQRPLRGYGVDNLSVHYGPVANPKAIEQRPPHVHDTLLQMAINGGLLAAGLYLWWMIVLLLYGYAAWQRLRKHQPRQAAVVLGITAGMLGFLVNGLFEFNFGTSQVITIVYFLSGLLPAYFNHSTQGPVWGLPEKPNLLFLRPRFRGDVLLASPVARLVKRDYPQGRVDLLTEPSSVGSAAGEPSWDHVYSLPRKGFWAWWQTVKTIRQQNYDVVCDLFGNPRTVLLALASGARFRIGPKVTVWDLLYDYRTEAGQPGARAAWESFYDILRAFGMRQLSMRPRWVITQEDDLWITSFLKERGVQPGKIIGLFPGGSHQAKRWPLKHFLELAQRTPKELGMKCIFVFGPLEKDLKLDYMHAAGKLSLSVEGLPPSRLAALWRRCAAVVSNDAFPMHLGPAVSTPTIGLFGPSDPAIWFPYPEKSGHRAVHAAPACWPCHKDVCNELACWQDVTPDLIMNLLKQVAKKKETGDKKSKAAD